MDRRQKKTRRAVYDAFAALLERKNYSSITVQEIIDEANIGRSTFYSHFETKDELLRALCSEIFDHVFAGNLTKERTHDFSSGKKDIRGEVTHILYHLQDSGRYIKRILSCESGEMFMSYFKEYLENQIDALKRQSLTVKETQSKAESEVARLKKKATAIEADIKLAKERPIK